MPSTVVLRFGNNVSLTEKLKEINPWLKFQRTVSRSKFALSPEGLCSSNCSLATFASKLGLKSYWTFEACSFFPSSNYRYLAAAEQ